MLGDVVIRHTIHLRHAFPRRDEDVELSLCPHLAVDGGIVADHEHVAGAEMRSVRQEVLGRFSLGLAHDEVARIGAENAPSCGEQDAGSVHGDGVSEPVLLEAATDERLDPEAHDGRERRGEVPEEPMGPRTHLQGGADTRDVLSREVGPGHQVDVGGHPGGLERSARRRGETILLDLPVVVDGQVDGTEIGRQCRAHGPELGAASVWQKSVMRQDTSFACWRTSSSGRKEIRNGLFSASAARMSSVAFSRESTWTKGVFTWSSPCARKGRGRRNRARFTGGCQCVHPAQA